MTEPNDVAYLHRVDCTLFYAISMIRDQSQAMMLCDMIGEAVAMLNLCTSLDDIRKKVHEAYSEASEGEDA